MTWQITKFIMLNSFISPSPRDSNLKKKKNYKTVQQCFFAILNLKCKGKDESLHRLRAFFNV